MDGQQRRARAAWKILACAWRIRPEEPRSHDGLVGVYLDCGAAPPRHAAVAAAGAAAAGGELRTPNRAAGREGVYRCDRGRGKGVKN